QAPKGVLVPAKAIVLRDGRSVLFVVAGGKAALRAVQPAAQDYGDMKLIPDALQPGDALVLSPPAALRDGSKVTLQKASP
ncbi:MAG: efflux RND transporter periplasmic adaptor subunit, partial [Xanthomonadaceae bacterium]|nr:efflux RND transporter periplasmic adaptor subunit [Xanthomonadaceae bacterium]